jgi:hypothetical protein
MIDEATTISPVADERYRDAAANLWSDDELEIDQDATVSEGDGGAWVQAWVWVSKEESEMES